MWTGKARTVLACAVACVVLCLPLLVDHAHQSLTGRSLLAGDDEDENKWTKKLFEHPGEDVFGSVLAFVTVAIASGGGIGGGGLLVPVYFLVLQLGRFAIPLSKATIFGGSVSNLILNINQRHPSVDRPLIAFDVTLMLEPMTLGGTIVGVLLNTLFPTWLITLLLIWLLGYTAKRTYDKAMKTYKKESVAKREPNAPKKSQVSEAEIVPGDEKHDLLGEDGAAVEEGQDNAEEEANRRKLRHIHEQEKSVDKTTIAIVAGTWVVVLIASLLKGGHGAPSVVGMKCNSGFFWITEFAAIGALIYITRIAGRHLHEQYLTKRAIGYEFAEGDVEWSERNIFHYPMLCTAAGVAAGLLGIGGGMVKGPLMLEMGVLPQVSAATSAFMILFTSSATTMQFVILGMLRLDYTLWYGMIGFVGGYVGKKGVGMMIKKHGRPSYVIFSLAFIIGLSCIVMGIIGIVEVAKDVNDKNWDAFDFNPLCHD